MRDVSDAPQADWPPPRVWTTPPPAGTLGGRLSVGRRPSWFWRIREDISPSLRIALATASLTAPLAVWIILVANHAVNPIFLPNPLDVLGSLRDLATEGLLLSDARASLQRVVIGFGISLLISVPLGLTSDLLLRTARNRRAPWSQE